MINNSDIQVIIRSAGERTEHLCANLINSSGFEHVRTIHEVPFSKAIRKGFEIGIESGKPWLFCIDADVLVTDEGIGNLFKVAEQQPKNVFEAQGLILDKFFQVRRPSGGRFYRMAYAAEAINCIPKEGSTLRPEGTMLKEMARRGYPWYQSDSVIGVHDFEQFYSDIFRKCFLHAKKHDYLMPTIMPYWMEQSKKDLDFAVAIMAAAHAMAYKKRVIVSKDFSEKDAFLALKRLKLKEKESILSVTNEDVSNLLRNTTLESQESLQEKIFPNHLINQIGTVSNASNLRSFNLTVKSLLLKVSDKLKVVANQL